MNKLNNLMNWPNWPKWTYILNVALDEAVLEKYIIDKRYEPSMEINSAFYEKDYKYFSKYHYIDVLFPCEDELWQEYGKISSTVK